MALEEEARSCSSAASKHCLETWTAGKLEWPSGKQKHGVLAACGVLMVS
jgi:hypothetical protein